MYLVNILICSQKYVQTLSDTAIIKLLVLIRGIYKKQYIQIKLNLIVIQNIALNQYLKHIVSYEMMLELKIVYLCEENYSWSSSKY